MARVARTAAAASVEDSTTVAGIELMGAASSTAIAEQIARGIAHTGWAASYGRKA